MKLLLLYAFMVGLTCMSYCGAADVAKASASAIDKTKKEEEFEIPCTEDLMREHGILRRVLLIYENIIHSIEHRRDFSKSALKQSTLVIQSFIQNYHEKLEEDYIFSRFEQHNKEVTLVKTLRKQHEKGRALTKRLLEIVDIKDNQTPTIQREVKTLLKSFIRMYRPHAAREDTILFPLVRSLMTEKEFDDMSEMFETTEHQKFGKEGFEGMVKNVASIEKALGILELDQFTA